MIRIGDPHRDRGRLDIDRCAPMLAKRGQPGHLLPSAGNASLHVQQSCRSADGRHAFRTRPQSRIRVDPGPFAFFGALWTPVFLFALALLT